MWLFLCHILGECLFWGDFTVPSKLIANNVVSSYFVSTIMGMRRSVKMWGIFLISKWIKLHHRLKDEGKGKRWLWMTTGCWLWQLVNVVAHNWDGKGRKVGMRSGLFCRVGTKSHLRCQLDTQVEMSKRQLNIWVILRQKLWLDKFGSDEHKLSFMSWTERDGLRWEYGEQRLYKLHLSSPYWKRCCRWNEK